MLYSSLSAPSPRHAATGSSPSRHSDSRRRHSLRSNSRQTQARPLRIPRHRLRKKALRIRRRNSHRRRASRRNRRRHPLIQQPRKQHHRHIARFAIGHAQPATNLLSMPSRFSVAVKNLPPPCTTKISCPSCQLRDLARNRSHQRVIFQQRSSEFDHSSHCSAVCSSMPSM